VPRLVLSARIIRSISTATGHPRKLLVIVAVLVLLVACPHVKTLVFHSTVLQAADISGQTPNAKKSPAKSDTINDHGPSKAGGRQTGPSSSLNPASEPNTQTATPAAREIEIGDIFEHQQRLVEAQKAYEKALETASGTEHEDAKKRLEKLLAREDGVKNRYVSPSLEKLRSSMAVVLLDVFKTLLAVVSLWFLSWIFKYFSKYWGRKKLQIGGFVDATGKGAGLAVAEVLKNSIEQVQDYYRPRDRFRFGSFNALIVVDSPDSEQLVGLVTEMVSGGAGKLLDFISKALFRPRYHLSGMVQQVGFRYGLLIRLVEKGITIQVWEKKADMEDLPESQEDLAFDVAMYVKERVESHGH
jgi:hypothetical protein